MTDHDDTPFVRIKPQDLYPDFSPDRPPDYNDFVGNLSILTPEYEAADAVYLAEYDKWAIARQYAEIRSSSPTVPFRYHEAFEMAEEAHAWAQGIITGGPITNLILYGPIGAGKTHTAVAVASLLYVCYHRLSVPVPWVQFHLASQMLKNLKDFSHGDKRDDLLWAATKAKVLVIDDLGRFGMTDYDQEQIIEIMDARMGYRPTIVTTNVQRQVELAEQFGDHLSSRLLGGAELVAVRGPDRRQK